MRLVLVFILCVAVSGCATEQEKRQSTLNDYFQSARNGDTERVFYCIRNGIAGINLQDSYGLTALMHAFIGEKFQTVRALIDGGADLEIRDRFGENILHKVASRSCAYKNRGEVLDLLKTLIGKGMQVNTKSELGSTPAFNAAGDGFSERLKLLIDAGAQINTVHRIMKGYSSGEGYINGVTPLMYASRMGAVENVKLLIDSGAVIDAVADNGWTAVMFAINAGYLQAAMVLIKNGADIGKIKNNSGDTAREMGLQSRNKEMRTFFKALGGK
jgi:uncharacterized protein